MLCIMLINLDDPISIFKFSTEISTKNIKIRSIFHCAGVVMDIKSKVRSMTPYNLEQSMSTNYFGPFLLTELLLNYLKGQYENDKQRINMVCISTRLIDKQYNSTVKHCNVLFLILFLHKKYIGPTPRTSYSC